MTDGDPWNRITSEHGCHHCRTSGDARENPLAGLVEFGHEQGTSESPDSGASRRGKSRMPSANLGDQPDAAERRSDFRPARGRCRTIVLWLALITVPIGLCAVCLGIPPLPVSVVLLVGLAATVTFAMIARPALAAVSATVAIGLSVWLVPVWSFFLLAAIPIWTVAYLFSPRRDSRRERVILASVLSALGAGALFTLAGAMAHGGNSTLGCEHNLEILYALIQESVDANGRLPIDDQRRLLVEDFNVRERAHFETESCCDDSIAWCYLLGRDVGPDDIGSTNSIRPTILLYDRPGNHLRTLGNGMTERVRWVRQEDALLLLSDGSILHWRGDSPAYREWVERYSQGIGEPFPPGMREQMREGHLSGAH